nr:bifunctional proline dehydrogenase/L-glutamate gamma-semialdehyde dehydrogenase [Pseudactinotalea sp. HY158]
MDQLIDPAIQLAREWASASSGPQSARERRTSAQLATLVADPAGLDLAVRFVDRVARPEDPLAAGRALAQLRGSAAFLSAADRVLLGAGSALAGMAPRLVIPAARARLRHLVGHLVVDSADPALANHLALGSQSGQRLNLNLLGEEVHGEAEAASRTERTIELLGRDDVDYVSVKVSSLVSQISTWDTAGARERVIERLRPLLRAAQASDPQKFVNLDMEEYRDLALTVEVFEHLLAEPECMSLQAGIALQAYLPDSVEAMDRLIGFALARYDAGGAPIKVRLVKGANLAMEKVEAELHGWAQAPYERKREVDANYLRLIERALRPENAHAVRLGVASHNLHHVAFAHLLAAERGIAAALDVEMLQGMAPAQVRAVQASVPNPIVLYTPVVARADFGVAVSYLVRRLEENAEPENFLHAHFTSDPEAMTHQEVAFRLAASALEGTGDRPRRSLQRPPAGPAFANTTDSDPALAPVRQRARRAVAEPAPEVTIPQLETTAEVERVVARGREAGATWSALPAADRAAVLRAIADRLEAHRWELVTAMAAEGGKTVAEADPEVSEAIDFARYYADRAEDLPGLAAAEGLTFTAHTLVLVTPPWNFPVAIPAGGVLAALAAGAAVVLKPAPQVPACGQVVVTAIHEALAAAGQPSDLVQAVRVAEDDRGRSLVAHEGVDAVILTGAYETARRFSEWRADRPGGPRVYAETSGKNALIVTSSADYDLAVADAVRSGFGHAGQKCSAASLLILVGSAGRSSQLRRQLIDAVSSLRVGMPTDLGAGMGPVIEAPSGKLERALTSLEEGESWWVEPRRLDESGRLWSPGLKDGVRPGSWFHHTECFGPVVGVMHARDLDEAIEWQNQVAYGLTGGLHSLDPDEIGTWLERVEVGNAYINRHITGAIVQRQSFGGWKRSAVGPGAKAGGPTYVAQLGTWSQTADPQVLGRVGPRVAAMLEDVAGWVSPVDRSVLHNAARSDGAARDDYSIDRDPSGLAAESNVLRYRTVPGATVRAGTDVTPAQVVRIMLAAACVGVPIEVSVAPAIAQSLPEDARPGHAGRSDQPPASGPGTADGVPTPEIPARLSHVWRVETGEEFARRVSTREVTGRVRVLGERELGGLARAMNSEVADVTLFSGPVLTSGRRELLVFLREQAVSRTLHRFGHVAATPEQSAPIAQSGPIEQPGPIEQSGPIEESGPIEQSGPTGPPAAPGAAAPAQPPGPPVPPGPPAGTTGGPEAAPFQDDLHATGAGRPE